MVTFSRDSATPPTLDPMLGSTWPAWSRSSKTRVAQVDADRLGPAPVEQPPALDPGGRRHGGGEGAGEVVEQTRGGRSPCRRAAPRGPRVFVASGGIGGGGTAWPAGSGTCEGSATPRVSTGSVAGTRGRVGAVPGAGWDQAAERLVRPVCCSARSARRRSASARAARAWARPRRPTALVCSSSFHTGGGVFRRRSCCRAMHPLCRRGVTTPRKMSADLPVSHGFGVVSPVRRWPGAPAAAATRRRTPPAATTTRSG